MKLKIVLALVPIGTILLLLMLSAFWINSLRNPPNNPGEFYDVVILFFLILLIYGFFCWVRLFGGSKDERPQYIRLIDSAFDDRLPKQLESIEKKIGFLTSDQASIEELKKGLRSVTVEMHILNVLLEEYAEKQNEESVAIANLEQELSIRKEEAALLSELSDKKIKTLKRILLAEAQSWSKVSLVLGILISIPLFWASEAIRVTWLVPLLNKLF